MNEKPKIPGELDAPDVTALERRIIKQLRTESGWWNGDRDALRVLRQYEITLKQTPPLGQIFVPEKP